MIAQSANACGISVSPNLSGPRRSAQSKQGVRCRRCAEPTGDAEVQHDNCDEDEDCGGDGVGAGHHDVAEQPLVDAQHHERHNGRCGVERAGHQGEEQVCHRDTVYRGDERPTNRGQSDRAGEWSEDQKSPRRGQKPPLLDRVVG
jgi:hypothetical protein